MSPQGTPMSAMPLSGLHAAITGAGRGIGLAVARELARMGATLSLLGRDAERLDAAVASLAPARCVRHLCDVGDPSAVAAVFEAIAKNGDGLSILVNNAGIVQSAKFEDTSSALWYDMLRVNLTGAYHCIRAALPLLREAQQARIVNVASTAGLVGYPYVTAYCAAKHGLVGLSRALAVETARTGITVNAVCPGYTETDILRDGIANVVARTGMSEAEALAQFTAGNPQGRIIQPREVADAVRWLCGDAAASVTGQAISVSGGEVMQ